LTRKILVVILLLAGGVIGALIALNLGAEPNPGWHNGRFQPCPDKPNCVCSQDSDLAHQIGPISYQDSQPAAVEKIKAIVSGLERTELLSESEKHLHYAFTSLLFRFTDDVEFFIDDEQKMIHLRSASRVGHSDFGVNRKRMEEIKRRFGL